AHLPGSMVFPAGCTRSSAICASAPASRSIAGSRRGPHVRHPRNAYELFEVPRDELRTVVGNDARLRLRVFLLGPLQYDLNLCLGHGLAQIQMHDESAIAVQHAAQIVERARNVDVAHVDMPMLERLRGLLEPSAFPRWFPFPFLQYPRLPQHPPH